MKRILVEQTINKIGEEVSLAGWVHCRRDHGQVIFIDLRDVSGLAQLVFLADQAELFQKAGKLRAEWVIGVKGTVNQRPEKMINPDLPTGQIEILVKELEILNAAETPPFEIDQREEVNEETRLKYRYLDLRQERLKNNLVKRHQVNHFLRNFLTEKEFCEIETPILTKSTPEGARDYVVPSRLQAGKFYALPQSPQQYKQLLMVAGFEKYFQIARCFRDEDTRGDRQPEFTQLDIETSFWEQDDILNMTEEMLTNLMAKLFPDKKITQQPFPRLTYQEAIGKYQSDKPDLRRDSKNPDELAFAFVVNFPMFEWRDEENRWDAVHHPFTRPQTEDVQKLKEKPGESLAWQYDLVCNGYEIGGGSLRSYRPEILGAVFEIMGHSKEAIREKFGHLLDAFSYGVPPHGGIALGLDRLLMILCREATIRQVIAFPKTGDGRDLMMSAPAEIDQRQLKELHLKIAD